MQTVIAQSFDSDAFHKHNMRSCIHYVADTGSTCLIKIINSTDSTALKSLDIERLDSVVVLNVISNIEDSKLVNSVEHRINGLMHKYPNDLSNYEFTNLEYYYESFCGSRYTKTIPYIFLEKTRVTHLTACPESMKDVECILSLKSLYNLTLHTDEKFYPDTLNLGSKDLQYLILSNYCLTGKSNYEEISSLEDLSLFEFGGYKWAEREYLKMFIKPYLKVDFISNSSKKKNYLWAILGQD